MPGSNEIRDKLKNLSPEQIRKLMSGRSGAAGSEASFKMTRNDKEEYPLSKNQLWFWFLSQVNGTSILNNIPLAVKLDTSFFDLDRFKAAMNQLIRENEILRTTFEERDGELIQKIHPPWEIEVEYEDLSPDIAMGETEQDIIQKIAAKHGMISFDLSKLPLLAIKVMKIADSGYVILFNLHHMISDGWTNSLLARDVSLLYNGMNVPASKSEKYQYVDYVKWEQNWLKSSKYEEGLNFWKKLLSDLPERLHFPVDFQFPDHTDEGRKENYPIPAVLQGKVTSFCHDQNITPFQFYISCYVLLLGIYTGQRDIIIGTPVANRNQRYFQNTFGLFINSLPIRFRPDLAQSFKQNLDSHSKVIHDCLQFQEVPFTEIVHAVNPQRDIKENALYSAHFAYQHFPQRNKEHEYALLPVDYKVSKFDLNFWIEVAGNESKISLTYKNKLFSPAKIKRFIEHYVRLIEEGTEHPDAAICELNVIPGKHLSILEGNHSDVEESSWRDLFDKSCQNHSKDIAIADELGTLTYNELNSQADSLSAALTDHGVHKGNVVIVKTGRSRKFIVSILACFKCGAIYLPADEHIADARLAYIYEDSNAKLILTEKSIEGMRCLCIDDVLQEQPGRKSFENIPLNSDDNAYIIYTSGSTGKPKGVIIPHGALLNYTLSVRNRINDENICSFAHVSALDADLGNTSIFSALGFGGMLSLPGPDVLVDPEKLKTFFSKYPVDALKIVPSHLNAFSEYFAGILPQKLLICGGEHLSPSLVSKIREAKPELRIINHYGPTEAAIGSITYEIPSESRSSVIPIGSPLNNTNLIIVDEFISAVPQGVIGEICLGGDQIAKGYLHRSDLTNEKFITIGNEASNRYYRTGDIGYINEDKQVVFLDRRDRQVKINGFRIELGELESVIRNYPGIANASVFVIDEGENRKKLCAAIRAENHPDFEGLKTHLKKHFSTVFIPSFFTVDEIPVTRNGKVDFNQLQQYFKKKSDKPAAVSPRDVTEITLVELFQSALNIGTVQLDDNFFDLGGHSLLAISLIQKINRAFQTKFSISVLFECGSVRELASRIRKETKTSTVPASPFVSLIRKENQKAMIWIHPAGGNVMNYYPVAKNISGLYDSYAFTAIDHHLRNDLTITGLAEEYQNVLESKKINSDICFAGWSMGALIAHEMAVRTAKEDGTERPLILLDQPVPNHEITQDQSYEDRLNNYIEKIEIFTGEKIEQTQNGEKGIDYALLFREFYQLNLVPEEVTVTDFKHFLDILVKHNNIISNFHPSVYHGPALLLKAQEKVMLKTHNPQPEYFLDDLGWGRFCTNLTIVETPGNHITMLNGEYVETATAIINEWIAGLQIKAET